MRRGIMLGLLLGTLALAGALAATALVATEGTMAVPRRACEPKGEIAVEFGGLQEWEGVRSVPVFVKNTGTSARTVFVDWWEADAYRVRWDGRLAPLPSQRTELDYVAGYNGERLEPGERHAVGHYQIQREAEGEILLLAWAGDACGRTRLTA